MAFYSPKPAWTTFTPTLTLVGGAGNTVPVYTTNIGRYLRDGNVVHVEVELTGDGGAEGAGTGQINIALPIAVGANAPTLRFIVGTGANGATVYLIEGELSASATTILLRYFSAINTTATMQGADQNNVVRVIRLAFTYEV